MMYLKRTCTVAAVDLATAEVFQFFLNVRHNLLEFS